MNDDNLKLDIIADEFEAAWRSGSRPQMRFFLNQVDSKLVSKLMELLIPLDIEYRMKADESVVAEDYKSLADVGAAAIARMALESQVLDPGATRDTGQMLVGDFDDVKEANNQKTKSRTSGPEPRTSRTIGHYRLLQPLGAGGMGEVWIAEQTEPVKRRVALKLIKSGVGSKEILTRFEGERQALALMNHPNIARILDAGTTDDGQPFFVMELVAGRPFTTWCDENKVSIDERLKLYMDVCSGVQHAHQKGIIHRDLKPGNIIVGMLDGKPVPKIIDFGLAKAIESTQRLTDQSLFTGIGQILGTLKYMSPEQASLDSIDIDTRTDIYALGVILYELLTGSTPLDDSSIKGQAALKLLEIIREKEPVKPSSRLGSCTADEKSSITNQRRTDSVGLNRVLTGDLDWIVMKALEKDRTRRYESASGFAADIRRYLNSEPVVARPPSLNYRTRKFIRKYRTGVLFATLFSASLLAGMIGTGWFALAANNASRRLGEESKKTKTALSETRETIDSYIETVTNSQLLREDEFKPLLKSLLSNALEHYERFIAEHEHDTHERDSLCLAILKVAAISEITGDHDKAVEAYNKGLQLLEALLRDDPEDLELRERLAGLLHNLGKNHDGIGDRKQALQCYRKSQEAFQWLLKVDPESLEYLSNQAAIFTSIASLYATEPAESEAAHQQSLAVLQPLVEQHPDVIYLQRFYSITQNGLGLLYRSTGRYELAFEAFEKALSAQIRVVNDAPGDTQAQKELANIHSNIGVTWIDQQEWDRALLSLAQSQEMMSKLIAERPLITEYQMLGARGRYQIAMVHLNRSEYSKALESLTKALPIQRSLAGEYKDVLDIQFDMVQTLNMMAAVHMTLEDADAATVAYQEAVDVQRRLCKKYPERRDFALSVAGMIVNMANLATRTEDFDSAQRLIDESVATLHKIHEQTPSDAVAKQFLRNALLMRGRLMQKLNRLNDAVVAFDQAIELCDIPADIELLRTEREGLVEQLKDKSDYDAP